MTKKITRFHLGGGKLHEADDGEWVRYVDVARFLPGFDKGREHPDTWVPHEPKADAIIGRALREIGTCTCGDLWWETMQKNHRPGCPLNRDGN